MSEIINSNILINMACLIKTELLDSSSSSSEDEFAIFNERKKHPRVRLFITEVVNHYSEEEFKTNFRVSEETAYDLIEKYGNSRQYVKRTYRGGRPQTTEEAAILSFLWFASNKNSFREVSNLFNMSPSCSFKSFNSVLNFLVEEIAPEIIKFPSNDEEKEGVAKDFQMISGFPNVLGCIDGSYIPIRTPKHKIKSTYANRHDCTSITLQGICDANLKFLDAFTGVPSKIHDSRVLKLSFIGKELPQICGSRFHLLGDSAYPLREYLLTPYRDYGNLTNSEKNFNMKFCQTRVKIENAFGMLKTRFRQLMRLDFENVETMSKFILACCTLHNLCIDKNDFWEEEDGETEEPDDIQSEYVENNSSRDILLMKLGQIKRNTVKAQL